MSNWLADILGILLGGLFIYLDERFGWSRTCRDILFNSMIRGNYLSQLSPEERKKEWEYMSKEDRKNYPEKKPFFYRFD